MRKLRTVTEPHVVKLPTTRDRTRRCIYGDWDIIEQLRVLSTYENAESTIRSAGPFTVKYWTKTGKEKIVDSKYIEPKTKS